MHIKLRKARALLYRSLWIPKGTSGNTHGYSTQTFVGSLAADAVSIPPELKGKLSDDEVKLIDAKIVQPARHAAEERRREEEHREVDPIWRLDEAARLSAEAAVRSERAVVPGSKVTAIHAALANVRTIAPIHPISPVVVRPAATTSEPGRSDPLQEALVAIRVARDAVLAGRYGSAPAEGVRATRPYKLWAEIFEAVEGAGSGSLLKALQTRGFAKTRGK
jgi:hypothetical protein